jgi:hypothetical protein
MGRLTPCLLILALGGSPALAAQGESARPLDTSTAVRLAAAYGVVTSTWRSVAHNRAVGGVPNSYHLQGRAIDIARRPGVTHRQIDAALRTAGYNLIESLDEGDHSHFAFAPAKNGQPAAVLAQAWPAPPTPQTPARERLAADDHGTLVLDLPAPAAAAIGAN